MLILWINQISKDDSRKGSYKVDKDKPCKMINLGFDIFLYVRKPPHNKFKIRKFDKSIYYLQIFQKPIIA